MALLDILTGKQSASGSQSSAGRVPPLAMALAGLLSYGKLQNAPGQGAVPAAGQDVSARLEDFFKPSPSGGPTSKGVIGALLTGGMMDLVKQFRGAGHADAVNSWVSQGPNQALTQTDLSKVLTEEQISFLTQRTGLSRDELLMGLSERLPKVVDQLTPDGRLPTSEELQRRM